MIIAVNDKGRQIANLLAEELHDRVSELKELSHAWNNHDKIIFIGAMGICVRCIAPYITDKHTDPAVVCVDSLGKNVISVLSGHVGGANDLTRKIADILHATPVITTQSDMEGLWPLDTIGKRYGWTLLNNNINKEIAAFVSREPTALYIDIKDEGTEYLLSSVSCPTEKMHEYVTIVDDIKDITPERFKLAIVVSPRKEHLDSNVLCMQYIPKCIHAGIGLAHQAEPAREIVEEIFSAIDTVGFYPESIIDFNTIDVKADEPVVKQLKEEGYDFHFYTSEELAKVDVPNPSETVNRHVGTPSVCEAAAILAGGSLIMPKKKGTSWTLALSLNTPIAPEGLYQYSMRDDDRSSNLLSPITCYLLPEDRGHIEIVGAGPGDPELVSVRGRKFLERADLILYAGSLVPKELTLCHKPGAMVRSSADMDLEEQFMLMKDFYDKGKLVVRLHTGDPCIYGAIQEQMAFFDKYSMDYHITPGISSFLAAAAELRSQFTIPEKCQTIILTRGEGRTAMPEKEKLHLLAQHQSTMCIFLSASLADQVQSELLAGGYPPETPVAACHKLTWKEQRIYRGELKDLAKMMKENNLTLTTMIVVGESIDNRKGLSKLYDGHFTHLFRKGK